MEAEELTRQLIMAASNGDAPTVRSLLSNRLHPSWNIDHTDDEGGAPLIYASCFVSNIRELLAVNYQKLTPLRAI